MLRRPIIRASCSLPRPTPRRHNTSMTALPLKTRTYPVPEIVSDYVINEDKKQSSLPTDFYMRNQLSWYQETHTLGVALSAGFGGGNISMLLRDNLDVLTATQGINAAFAVVSSIALVYHSCLLFSVFQAKKVYTDKV